MRFYKKDFDSYNKKQQLLAVERPYLGIQDAKLSSNPEDYIEIPSILIGLAQIAEYYHPHSNFKTFSKWDAVDIHKFSCDLVSHDKSQWAEEFDRLMSAIDGINDHLVKKQILPKSDLLKQVMYAEIQAIESGEFIFWRFDTQGAYTPSRFTHAPQGQSLSLSDNLLAGYILDGKDSCDPACGISNFSACTFSYYENYALLLHASKNNGRYFSDAFNQDKTLSESYIVSNGPLENYQLYGVQLSYADIFKLYQDDKLVIPRDLESTGICFGSGESFHPRIKDHALVDLISRGQKIDLYSNCNLHIIATMDAATEVLEEVALLGGVEIELEDAQDVVSEDIAVISSVDSVGLLGVDEMPVNDSVV